MTVNINSISHSYIQPKFPNSFYHFTPKAAADEILSSGEIYMSNDQATYLSGVFLVAIENINNWTKQMLSTPKFNVNFLTALLCHTIKDYDELSCFEIPISNLNKKNISIRSQNELLAANKNNSIADFVSTDYYNFYNNKGDAVEFLYEDNIPIDNNNFKGTVKVPGLLKNFFDNCHNYSSMDYIGSSADIAALETFKKLFSDSPEQKAFDIKI